MAANLTSVVMQFLTPEVIAQIASFLGLDKATTQKATGGAVPALLASLSDLVSTPTGTSQLSKLMSQQPAGSPTELLRTGGAQGLAETGSNMLSSLFGGRTMDALAQAVGKFAGTGESGGKLLLSMLGPIVLGSLGQQQRNAGLDTNGLASLLRSQKDQIVAAIPPGLSDQLGAAGLIDRVAGAPGRASTVGTTTTRQTPYTTANKAQWPYWLAALVILGGLAWYAADRVGQQNVAEQQPARPTTGTVGMAPADLTVDGVNLANKFNSSVDSLKTALPGITDAASAQAALPKIADVQGQLNDISARVPRLSADGRSSLAKMIAAATPAINQLCDRVVAMPEAGPVVKPAIDDLRAKLDSLARV